MSKPWTTWSDGAATRPFCGFSLKYHTVYGIRAVDSTFFKRIPNHTITIGINIKETQSSSLLYGCGAIYQTKRMNTLTVYRVSFPNKLFF
jgi:hypothetical protein